MNEIYKDIIAVKIDNKEIHIPAGISIIEACEFVGITIPRFCYHELLSVSGNCRMCLIEIDNVEKPVASCVTEIKPGMEIYTNNAFTKKARENVLETLLVNHPLDCPICDQAGECDLQDETKYFGSSKNRYTFFKKTVEDKDCNPIIKMVMTRCITCTRCVRFGAEIAGVEYFGTINRGRSTEITSYNNTILESELSGNFVDLCPVGALTNKPYAFTGRPWELRLTESIDLSDSLGSNVYINHKSTKIYRILPKINRNLNESIIADSTRYLHEHLSNENITKNVKSKFSIKKILNFKRFAIDNKINVNLLHAISQIKDIRNVKVHNVNMNNKNNLFITQITKLNKTLKNINNVYILGSNVKIENVILNQKLRFLNRINDLSIHNIGFNFKDNISLTTENVKIKSIFDILNGKRKYLKKSTVIFGESLKNRINSLINLKKLFQTYNNNNNSLELSTIANTEFAQAYKYHKQKKYNSKDTLEYYLDLNQNVLGYFKDFKYNKINSFKNKTSSLLMQEGLYINIEHRCQKTANIGFHF